MNKQLQELSNEADKVIYEWIDERLKDWGIVEDEEIDLEISLDPSFNFNNIRKLLFDDKQPTVKDYLKNLTSRVTNIHTLPTYLIIEFSNNKQIIIRTQFLKENFDSLDELMIYDYDRLVKEYREWREGQNDKKRI